uniref:KIB1-4 beta-propeller domain-containing protein n=1 Tax=Oryza punctata TaxID=4537 RepID=A0A0E0M0T6_ORYPU
MLWFHYNYYMSLEESDDNEQSGDDDDVSNGDEFSETSDEDEYIEETNDDGRSEDNETDVSDDDDDDDNTIDEAKEVNDTLLLYSISSKQLVAHSKLDDLKDHFYWITPQVGGQFYTTFGDRIVTLEFLPYPTFDIVPIKSAQNTVYHYADICLLESSGDLFILFFYHPMTCFQKTVEIDVHKLDITRRAWVKVDTLGDRAFIVNITENSGASVNAKEVYLDENCIYFFTCRYKRLYVHNLERGTTTALNPGADINVAAQILMPAF